MTATTSFTFPLEHYLQRINYGEASTELKRRDENLLMGITRAQAYRIPFENIDAVVGLPIRLDTSSLCQKLLDERRGGYCFELNGLLALALSQLGFDPEFMLARNLYKRATPAPRTHIVIRVTVAGRQWLVDAGFGGPALRWAMPLEFGREDRQENDVFKIRADATFQLVLQRWSQDENQWQDLYGFSREPVIAADIDVANHYVATSPNSTLRKILLCARPIEAGRISLIANELKIFKDGKHSQKVLREDELGPALEEYFCLQLPNHLSAKFNHHD